MERFHLPCPKVVCLKKHVLAMSFLGENRNSAPKLKEAKLSDAEWQIAYEQCVAVSVLMECFVNNLKTLSSVIICTAMTFDLLDFCWN